MDHSQDHWVDSVVMWVDGCGCDRWLWLLFVVIIGYFIVLFILF